MKKRDIIGILAVLIIGMVLMSGCANTGSTSTTSASQYASVNGDKAALSKMTEMNKWMKPTTEVIGDSAISGDYLKMGINAVLLRKYIDQNSPEMRQLAEGDYYKETSSAGICCIS